MTTLQPIRDAITEKTQKRQLALQTSKQALDSVAALNGEISDLQAKLRSGKALELAVSDHALLRYAERVLGFDRTEVVNLIRDKVGPAAFVCGAGKFPLCDGFCAVVKSGVVVTIEPND